MNEFRRAVWAEFRLETHQWRGMAKAVLVVLAGLLVVLASAMWKGVVEAMGGAVMFTYFLSFAHPLVDGFLGIAREWRSGSATLSMTVSAPRTALVLGKGLATWARFVALQAIALAVLLALGLGVAYVHPRVLWLSGLMAYGTGPHQMLMYWYHYAVPISLVMVVVAPLLAGAGQLLALVHVWFNRGLVAWLATAGLVVVGSQILQWWASETDIFALPGGRSIV